MKECFLTKRGGDGTGASKIPFIIFEGFKDSYNSDMDFTGFNLIDTGSPDGGHIDNFYHDSTTIYCFIFSKSDSIDSSASNYKDSAIICTNEEIDFSGYNVLCIDSFNMCDFSYTNDFGAYLKIDKPQILPQSHVAYDWTDWDKMPYYYKNNEKYYYDISSINGKHFVSIGLYHGKYATGYTNHIVFTKIMLL